MAKDEILSFFVQAANHHDFSTDITLHVNGTLVTGTIVSAASYFSSLRDSISEENDVAKQLKEALQQAKESADKRQGDVEYIHLKNMVAYLAENKTTPSDTELLWRGKISEVDGFFLGRMTDQE
ncbi:gas vesicle accessory protein GvpU [Terribacillus saccharophilus]|uniref:gas vesicle accessory protein GvpU n=1 Tax=Terribacillus saccharophilus TaxID=361277 RepID=UPI0039828BF7